MKEQATNDHLLFVNDCAALDKESYIKTWMRGSGEKDIGRPAQSLPEIMA